MIDLYCIGGVAVDLLLKVPRLPLKNEKLGVQFAGLMGGGLIANAACAAARLGLKTSWSGLLGDDAYGQMLIQEFAMYGVGTAEVIIQQKHSTDFTVILLYPDGERTILLVPVLPSPPPLTAAVKHTLQQSRLGYTLPYTQDWFAEFAESVHTGGGKVAIDLEGSTSESVINIKAILNHTDIVFCSEDGLQVFTGKKQIEEKVAGILSFGPEMVVLTLGEKGAKLFTRTAQYSASAYDVPIVDTTGAGDCFHAAFLFGILANWDLQRCLEFASAAAALLVQELGARGGLPTFAEVQNFISSHSL